MYYIYHNLEDWKTFISIFLPVMNTLFLYSKATLLQVIWVPVVNQPPGLYTDLFKMLFLDIGGLA